MVMASVSGSVARNSVFFWLAKSATARPTLERKVPARKETFSRVSSSSATRTASPGVRAVVAEHDLQLAPAEHAALGVDLVLRQLHAVAIGHGEGGHAAVGVELADLDGLALRHRRAGCEARRRCDQPRRGRSRQDGPPRLHSCVHALNSSVSPRLARRGTPCGRSLCSEISGPALSDQGLWRRSCPVARAVSGCWPKRSGATRARLPACISPGASTRL